MQEVYILFYESFETRGVLAVGKSRDVVMQKYREYQRNPRLINDFLNDIFEYWVESDPDDAIEVWAVSE